MSINIIVRESIKESVASIPLYIIISVDQPANIFYTLDGSAVDTTGLSLNTFSLVADPGTPLSGTLFLPTNKEVILLNILAVGVGADNTGFFHKRYEIVSGAIRRTGIRNTGTGVNVDLSDEILGADGNLIGADGYTYGSSTFFKADGYDAYYLGVSGKQVSTTDIDGYADGYGFDGSVVAWTDITPEAEQVLEKKSQQHTTSVDTLSGKVIQELNKIDPRSPGVVDFFDRAGTVTPIGHYIPPTDYDDLKPQERVIFTGRLPFDPNAAYIKMDARVDGYMNGSAIVKSDVRIINKPYGELRYCNTREDLGDMYKKGIGYISGGLTSVIYNYAKNEAAFYYFDTHDNRWVESLVKFTPPDYSITEQRNGVVVAHVFRWIGSRRNMPV